MEKKRLEWRVGLFVFFGLLLLGILLVQFSQGTSLFSPPTYKLYLTSKNVGGLKTRASVLMAGVQVGTVSDIELNPGGTNVTITLSVSKKFSIHSDARFVVEQAGFLGDQYVAVTPMNNQGALLQPEDHATMEEPLNLQEVARSAQGFILRIDETARKLNDSVNDVRRLFLNPPTLTNLATAALNMRMISERVWTTVNNVNFLIDSNGPQVSASASNLLAFSRQMNEFANSLNDLLNTNGVGISSAVSNIDSSTAMLKDVLGKVQSGQGLAGTLLSNQQVGTNIVEILNNLSVTTSNLNRLGLWGILWSKKQYRTMPPPARAGEALQKPPP
jgi:phospholipid/cholesterol/gamma-HCH transport system substrate-binding protein